MSMSMGPIDAASEQQLLDAFNKQAFDKTREEQKKDNDFINAVQEMKALTHRALVIQQYQITREKALAATDSKERKIHQEKAEELLEHIRTYYAEKREIGEQMLADYDKKSPLEKIQALDIAINEVKAKRDIILQDWTSEDDKKLWIGEHGIKTWEQGISTQAAHYARKTENTHAVLAVVNDNIASIETKGFQLSNAEKLQLLESRNKALERFKEDLARTSQEQLETPMSDVMLQLKHAQLLLNPTLEMNQVIATLNKNRPPESQIPSLDINLNRCLAFVNKNESTQKNMAQMTTNMQNFVMMHALAHQEKVLNLAKTSVEATSHKILHCEVNAARTIGYDADNGSRFAIHAYGSNNYNILEKACNAINQEGGKPLSLEKQPNGNIQFNFNNQNFHLNTRSGKFTGDNISPETFQMLMKVYNQVYQNNPAELRCHDPASKSLCDAVIKNNKTTQKEIQVTSLISSIGKPVTASQEKRVTPEKQEKQEQNVTSSRKFS